MSGVPIGKAKHPDETPVYRNIDNVEELSKLPEDEPCTVYELIQSAFEKFKDEYYLGSITKDKSTGQPEDQVKWRTFGEVKEYVDKLANSLWHLIGKDTNSNSDNKQSTVAFYGPNSFELWTGDLACSYHKFISVGIFDTYGEDTAIEVLNNCEASILFTTSHKIPFILANYEKLKFLKIAVCVDDLPANDTQNSSSTILRKWAKSTNKINLLSYEELLKIGTDHIYPLHKPSGEDIAAICYTSGTSGTPKGAMQTHLNFISSTYYSSLILRNFDEKLITFSYLPLAHTYERVLQYQLLWCGAQVGFYSGDITRFLRDIQIIKPIILPSVPRLLNRLKDTITENYSKSSNEDTVTLFKLGLEAKLSLLKEEGICVHEDWDKLIFSKISQFLGGSIQIIITGSAPLSEETKDFFKVCLGCIVIEGYGATETSANVTSNPASSNTPNQVGAPNGCNEIKLKSVPEMNYLVTDKPYPRGEILVRGANIFKGYYNQPEKTREVIDDDGFYKSGDIGYFDDNGLLYIIDRKSSVFKLSQGEYVTPERVELAIQRHPVVQTCWVGGKSTENHPVSIVIPNPSKFKAWYTDRFDSSIDDSELNSAYQDEKVIEALVNEIKEVCVESKLSGFEIPKKIYIESEPFTIENQLLTPTQKLCRPKLQKHYNSIITKLYN